MKKYFNPYYLIILLIFLFTTNYCYPQSLFKIYERGKIGFIDSTGRVLIKPKDERDGYILIISHDTFFNYKNSIIFINNK